MSVAEHLGETGPNGLGDVAAAVRTQAPGRGLPPVHLWNPAHSGDIDIVIKKGGQWFHEGTPIGRDALVRLFSTVLRRDPDGFHLVTPVEKLKIEVEDAPFVAIRVDEHRDDAGRIVLRFTTNVGDVTDAGRDNPIRVEIDKDTSEPRPYVHVRRGLEALISRPVFYELAELAEERDLAGEPTLSVESGGVWFPISPPGAHLL